MEWPNKQRQVFYLFTLMSLFFAVLPVLGSEEELWQYRNLGKAFYENPTTQLQAVEMFEKALELAPDSPRERINYGIALVRAGKIDEGIIELLAGQKAAPHLPHTWFNLGIIYKKRADYDKAQEQFEKMVELVPDEAISRYNLGVLLKLNGKQDESLEHFLKSAELNPNLAGPHFQIYSAYRAMGQAEDAARELKIFQETKKRQVGASIPEDLEWSYYSEILDDIEPSEPIGFSTDNRNVEIDFRKQSLTGELKGDGKGQIVLDSDGDGNPDLLSWSKERFILHLNGVDLVNDSGLESVLNTVSVTTGDFDNDGLTDLCIITEHAASIYQNRSGKFEKIEYTLPSGSFAKSLWHDFDHDSDLDLFLLGESSFLVRNDGSGKFSDQTDRFPFVDGNAVDGTQIDLLKDTDGSDLVVVYDSRPAVLYRDRLGGRFDVEEQLQINAGANRLWAEDLNNDGWTDLIARDNRNLYLLINQMGILEKSPLDIQETGPVLLIDIANRGIVDLVVGNKIYSNQGLGRFTSSGELLGASTIAALSSADFDLDGKADLAVIQNGGQLSFLKNETDHSNNWIRVKLTGVRNARLAPGAEIEMKAGSLYQKRFYSGSPVHFGLGTHVDIDTVRITWPNGLIQNEPKQQAGSSVEYKEKQRLSGSCPMVFTWNGEQFQFISDVLAVAPLGAAAGVDQYFQVDHDEYLQIPGEALAKRGEHYEIRITEELRETGFLDQIKLFAIDRPVDMEIFTSEKFKSPPFPEFRLFGIRNRIYPVSAIDDSGNDVLGQIVKLDKTYPSDFYRDYTGVAELHSIELDFGKAAALDNDVLLVLSGWVDFADGSTILRTSQNEDSTLVMPYLQVRDSGGRWQTVNDDMGIPAGKPKTIVVDLAGRFLSESREVRIVTNLCVYWDEIYLTNDTASPGVNLVEVPLEKTDLKFRGFSTPTVHPNRKQPEYFEYSQWVPISMWNPASGYYTRFGPVDELVTDIDDRYVIMGPGDELRLLFDGALLPQVKEGFKRDFLLFVDGWAKDGDLNTAHSQTVGPLPFHSMTRYPYPSDEKYPDDPLHQEFIENYNSRPALRLIRPLNNEPDTRVQSLRHGEIINRKTGDKNHKPIVTTTDN